MVTASALSLSFQLERVKCDIQMNSLFNTWGLEATQWFALFVLLVIVFKYHWRVFRCCHMLHFIQHNPCRCLFLFPRVLWGPPVNGDRGKQQTFPSVRRDWKLAWRPCPYGLRFPAIRVSLAWTSSLITVTLHFLGRKLLEHSQLNPQKTESAPGRSTQRERESRVAGRGGLRLVELINSH